MTQNKFAELDTAIVAAIHRGVTTFYRIRDAVEDLARPLAGSSGDVFRVVDRRLQALRKRGLIEYSKKEWKSL